MSPSGPEAVTGPRAMNRVLRLFEVLAASSEGLSLSDLSARLGVPKSTLHNSLKPLESDGYLSLEGTLYRLGPKAFRLATEISSSWSLPRLMHSYIRQLSEEAGETSLLSILDERERRFVHIDAVESKNRVRYAASLGTGGPLYASASGRVLLAFQSEDFLDQYFDQTEFAMLTKNTKVDAAEIRHCLEQVREDRYCKSVGEIEMEGAAVAAPVFGPRGTVVAAIGVALPISRMEKREKFLIDAVRKVAALASGGTVTANAPAGDKL